MPKPTAEQPEAPEAPAFLRRRNPSEQRHIIRQTAIKCATDLVAAGKIDIELLFKYAGRITAWVYTDPGDAGYGS